MSNVSKCFSCVHKNDYDPKFGYYGCNLSGQECKGYSMFEPKAKPKPTNADRIRSMSDGELAQFLMESFACSLDCPAYDICDAEGACVEFLAKWLKKEVELK